MVMLSSGDPIPSDPTNRPWAARIDEFMPGTAAVASGIHPSYPGELCGQFARGQSTDQAKDDSSNLFAHLEPFNEEKNNSARSAAKRILIGPAR